MRYVAVTLCVLLGVAGSLRAQEDEHIHEHEIDSAMAISPDFMPVFTAPLPDIFFNPLQYTPIDTTLFYIPEYSAFWDNRTIYQSLGINGQAHKSIVFDYEHPVGFNMLNLPFPLYFKQQKDLRYFDVQTSFTNIEFLYGFTVEKGIKATHAQKFKHSELILDLNASSNSGYFIHQGANMLALDAVYHFETTKKIYGFTASYILNRGKYAENGGLSDYHAYMDKMARDSNSVNKLGAFEVNFSNGNSLVRTHDALFQQYVNIKDKQGHYFGTITHSFQFKNTLGAFYDYNLNNDYYRNIYYISPDTTSDTLRYYSIINAVQISNYKPLERVSDKNYFIRLAGGIRHEFTNARMPYYMGNTVALFARANIRLFKVWDLYGSFSYSFFKYNKNDATANVQATFAINRNRRHFLGFGADFYRVSPDYFLSHYHGNNNDWEYDWKKQNVLKLSAFWTRLDYKVSFNYFMLSNYVYLNDHSEPTKNENAVNLLQLNLYAPLRLKNFYMDANFSLQHATQSCVSVPLFSGKLYAAYCFHIFRNRLRLLVGADLWYNTLYFADGYNPLIHQFYHQERVDIGNYLYFNANVTLQVVRTSFFFRAGNLLAGAIGYNYFTTPYYPMQGINFEVGVKWRFYD